MRLAGVLVITGMGGAASPASDKDNTARGGGEALLTA